MANQKLENENRKCEWLILHFVESDPGCEFEILPRSAIVNDSSREALNRGLKVEVMLFGNAKVQAYVVDISDDYAFLEKNFKLFTSDYTKQMLKTTIYPFRRMKMKIKSKEAEEVHPPRNEEIVKEISNNEPKDETLLTDKGNGKEIGGNSDKNDIGTLREENDRLKLKYKELMSLYEKLRTTLYSVLNKTDMQYDNFINEDKENLRQVVKTQKKFEKVNMQSCIVELGDTIYMGRHKTKISKEIFDSINWLSCSAATRKLLVTIFSKDVLGTHTLTGKPSPAFLNSGKDPKEQLDPHKTADIIEVVSRKCHVTPSVVRNSITTKCADENKMRKKRGAKRKSSLVHEDDEDEDVDEGTGQESDATNDDDTTRNREPPKRRRDEPINLRSKKLKIA